MRKEIYKAICQRLKRVDNGAIQHIDLWNRNVEFIEQEDGWSRPAVFIEFGPIIWQPLTGGHVFRGDAVLKLHIVTDWKGSAADGSPYQDESLAYLELSQKIQQELMDMSGESYDSIRLTESHTNHDHEEIVESVEVYKFRCNRKI